MNKRGTKTEHWGTPRLVVVISESTFSDSMNCL